MLNINYRDGRPVYLQVKDELRLLIVTGAVEPGGKIPSVRELASELDEVFMQDVYDFFKKSLK